MDAFGILIAIPTIVLGGLSFHNSQTKYELDPSSLDADALRGCKATIVLDAIVLVFDVANLGYDVYQWWTKRKEKKKSGQDPELGSKFLHFEFCSVFKSYSTRALCVGYAFCFGFNCIGSRV